MRGIKNLVVWKFSGVLVIVLLTMSAAFGTPYTYTLEIDASTSYIYASDGYVDVFENGEYFFRARPISDFYEITGSFNINIVDNIFWSSANMYFDNADIITHLLPLGPFNFPSGNQYGFGYIGLIDGSEFWGSNDPCAFWSGSGTCWSMGRYGGFNGSFDGVHLSMGGEDPHGDWSAPFYFYTINAMVGSVTSIPEPSTLLLLASGLAGVIALRKRLR